MHTCSDKGSLIQPQVPLIAYATLHVQVEGLCPIYHLTRAAQAHNYPSEDLLINDRISMYSNMIFLLSFIRDLWRYRQARMCTKNKWFPNRHDPIGVAI
jgi:hypothetical protein